MYFDGIIFDLDGTLWDCSEASAAGFNLAYEKIGCDHRVTADFIKSISGRPSSECDEILLSYVPRELRSEAILYFDKYELESLQEYAPNSLYPGVLEGLHSLHNKYPLYVVSNCGVHYLSIFLEHTPIGKLFSDTECYGRTLNSKDKNILSLIERQKLQAPCYIGDTAGDENAAMKANVPFFHAAYGFGKPKENPVGFKQFNELTAYFTSLR